MANPQDLLYSLPTLADPLPAGDKVDAVPEGAFHLHEDDWRQVEFVDVAQRGEVTRELRHLRTFIAEHRKGAGFTGVHLRTTRPEGLSSRQLEPAALDAVVPPTARRRELVMGTPPWGPYVVSGGFAIELAPNAVLYGQVTEGYLVTLALPLAWRRGGSADADAVLTAISRTFKLALVDWRAASWVSLD